MDVKKENPSKVVIIPHPPRCANPGTTPIDSSAPVVSQKDAAVPDQQPVAPGNPLNNQVEGPTEGLAGASPEEPKSK
jgi:hypothetical protein